MEKMTIDYSEVGWICLKMMRCTNKGHEMESGHMRSWLPSHIPVCLMDEGYFSVSSIPVCLSLISYITLPIRPARPNQIKAAVPGRQVKDRSKRGGKKWIFHRNHYIKIQFHWKFATREALTTISVCHVKTDSDSGHQRTFPDLKSISDKYIHTFTSV